MMCWQLAILSTMNSTYMDVHIDGAVHLRIENIIARSTPIISIECQTDHVATAVHDGASAVSAGNVIIRQETNGYISVSSAYPPKSPAL